MRIIEPSFRLSTPYSDQLTREDGIRMLRFIEEQSRISHRSENRQTLDSWERFIQAVVIGHGDWSVVEHCSVTATIRTDRGITHEIVRHRAGFSYTQESTRFVRYKNTDRSLHEFEFVMPLDIKGDLKSVFAFEEHCQNSEYTYNYLLERGGRPQEARSVLPNALASTIAVTGNLRSWRWWLLARTTKETHPDFRRISEPMLAEFKKVVPILFDDIEAGARQIDNARKAH